MRYLTKNNELNLKYDFTQIEKIEKIKKTVEKDLVDYIDSAYADCLNTRSFTFSYIYFLWNELINWSFKR